MAAPTLNGEVAHGTLTLVSATAAVITLTADVVGNLLVLGLSHPSAGVLAGTATDSRGNTWGNTGSTSASGLGTRVLVGRMDYPLRAGDTINVNVTTGGVSAAFSVLDYSNAHVTSTTVDKFGSGTGTSNAASSGGSGITTVNDEIILGFTGLLAASGYSAAGAGYTQRGSIVSTASVTCAFEDKTQSATGSQIATATLTGSPVWGQSVICIRGSTRWYVDYNKADDTGAGTSWATAKKNLSAVTPLSGDTVTMAKSADPAAQTGTMTFTDNSTSVGTSADLTAAVAAKDMVGPYTGSDLFLGDGWWEVASITASTITLSAAYAGTTRTTVTGYKMNGFDAGSPALTSTIVVGTGNVNGSKASPIPIVGGYDTGLDSRTGITFHRVSGATRQGIGLSSGGSAAWNAISYCGSARFTTNLQMNQNGMSVSYYTCASAATVSIAQSTGTTISLDHFLITRQISTSQTFTWSGVAGHVSTGYVRGDSASGVTGCFQINAAFTTVDSVTVYRAPSNHGIQFSGQTDFSTIKNCTASFCVVGLGLVSTNGGQIVAGCTFSNNTTADIRTNATSNSEMPCYFFNNTLSSATPVVLAGGNVMTFDRYNATAKSFRIYSPGIGTSLSNTAQARSDTCVEIQPGYIATDARGWTEYRIQIPVIGSGTLTVTCYTSASATWNGGSKRDIGLQRFGQWIGSPAPGAVLPGTSWVLHTFTYTMVEKDVVELVLFVNGTAGSVYLDDVSWSMA